MKSSIAHITAKYQEMNKPGKDEAAEVLKCIKLMERYTSVVHTAQLCG